MCDCEETWGVLIKRQSRFPPIVCAPNNSRVQSRLHMHVPDALRMQGELHSLADEWASVSSGAGRHTASAGGSRHAARTPPGGSRPGTPAPGGGAGHNHHPLPVTGVPLASEQERRLVEQVGVDGWMDGFYLHLFYYYTLLTPTFYWTHMDTHGHTWTHMDTHGHTWILPTPSTYTSTYTSTSTWSRCGWAVGLGVGSRAWGAGVGLGGCGMIQKTTKTTYINNENGPPEAGGAAPRAPAQRAHAEVCQRARSTRFEPAQFD